MDGIHDLGGKEGFGPIEVDEPEVPFKEEWEGRAWAIASSTAAPDWTIDWWRHVRELIEPADYLTRHYFDSWAQTQLAAFINSGVFTLEEATSGKLATPSDSTSERISAREAVALDATYAFRFDREVDWPPAFRVGDRVRTKRTAHAHHARLPAYARGRRGAIHANHGAHVFPDLSAQGKEEAQHLYSVVFDAHELWPESGAGRDRVFLDLWESYLEAG
jgi:nitrile hydratase